MKSFSIAISRFTSWLLYFVYNGATASYRIVCKTYAIRVSLAVTVVIYPLLAVNVNATSIVIRRTPNAITIGADSKFITYRGFTDILGRKQVNKTETTMCKIRQLNDTAFFAIAGQYDFDPFALAVENCKQGGTFLE